MENNLFLFEFERAHDRVKIIKEGPWSEITVVAFSLNCTLYCIPPCALGYFWLNVGLLWADGRWMHAAASWTHGGRLLVGLHNVATCCLLQRYKLPGELLHVAAASRLLIELSNGPLLSLFTLHIGLLHCPASKSGCSCMLHIRNGQ
ncbi:hypothetical protein Dimus_016375 [Dionaea muscipula]